MKENMAQISRYRLIILMGIICILIGLLAGCAGNQTTRNQNTPQKVEGETAKPLPSAPEQNTESDIKDTSVQVTSQHEKSKDEFISFDLSIPQIVGLKDQKKQTELNRILAARTLSMKAEALKEAREWYQEVQQAGGQFHPYEIVSEYEVRFNNNGILSITVEYYQYSGGAHGGTILLPYNFDLQTGKELALADLFKAGFDYQRIIDEEVRKLINTHPQDFFQDEEGFRGIGDNRPYYIIANQVVVYFGQYEIAPYSTGIPEFPISLGLFGKNIDQRLVVN